MMRRPELGFEFVANIYIYIYSMQILSIKTKKLNRCHESAMYQIQNQPAGANHIKLLISTTTTGAGCGPGRYSETSIPSPDSVRNAPKEWQTPGSWSAPGIPNRILRKNFGPRSVKSSHWGSKSEIPTIQYHSVCLNKNKLKSSWTYSYVSELDLQFLHMHIPSKAHRQHTTSKYLSHLVSNFLPSLIISISFQGFSTSPGHASW